MYKTTDEHGRERTIDYTVWSEIFTCPAFQAQSSSTRLRLIREPAR